MHRKVSTALLNSLIILSTLLALVLSAVGVTPAQAAPADDATSPLTLADLPIAAQPAVSDALGRGDAAYHFVPYADVYPLAVDSLIQQAYLKASNTGAYDNFGWSVAISGDTMVVGAFGEESNAMGVNGEESNNDASYSGAVYVFTRSGGNWIQQAYLKASNTEANDRFGRSVAISGDTLVVGADGEDSNATGVDGNQNNNSAPEAGAAYVFTRSGTTWTQQAYLKASNTDAGDVFGGSVAISGDTIVVGALLEDSSATGVNGNQGENYAPESGAAYVFTRSGTTWSQQAYLKASNTGTRDGFGGSVAISGDTLVVGAPDEDSEATGVNGDESNDCAPASGAAYVFTRSGTTWSQQAYLKASNVEVGSYDVFGSSVSISGDTIVVGAFAESSSATGVDGDQSDNSASGSGAAYVFTRNGETWSQQAYLKASNTGADDRFGRSVAISGDTLVVGASLEASNATGVNGDGNDNSAPEAGAAYVFTRSGTTWSQQAYLKASNAETDEWFGRSVAISGDTLVVGAPYEDSNATGVNGDGSDNSASYSGAAYAFLWTGAAPTVQSITVAGPNPIDGACVDFTVTFDKPVSGVDKDDFILTKTGGIVDPSIVKVAEVSQSVYTVTVNVGTGYGSLRLDLRATATIEDLSAHAFIGPYTSGETYTLTIDPLIQQAYLKASNTGADDGFGSPVAISGDTLVVGAPSEDSKATGVNGNWSDNSAPNSGAVYVFTRSGGNWIQQAYLKASNTGADDQFGSSVAISGDTIVVGANGEESSATGVNGNQSDNSAYYSGAAYVFTRSGETWIQQAYLKASNTGADDNFGRSVAISDDTIVVGATGEASNATGVDGDQSNNDAYYSGAVYVFTRSGGAWNQQAYLKASNTEVEDGFGFSVAISSNTLVVGAYNEESYSGAVYVFTRNGGDWSQQAHLKSPNTREGDRFGCSVAISGDTLVVGEFGEDAVYVFTRSGGTWSQQAYLKASNTGVDDLFGWSVAISGDTIVVGAMFEDSNATGVDGDGNNDNTSDSGAAYIFTRNGGNWSQQAYLKASNTGEGDWFGYSVAISGNRLVVGAPYEDSNATGVNGDENDNSASGSGAAYAFLWKTEAAPKVQSIAVAGANPIDGAGLDFTVTFSKPVTGVDKADFSLTKAGSIMGASVTKVVAVSQSVYTVTVNSGIGNGTLRLDLPATANIQDLSSNAFVGPYTGGETYTVSKGAAPTVPVLKLPKNKSLLTTSTPTLDWGDSSQVMALATGWHYEIQVTAPYGAYNETFNTQASADAATGLGASTFDIPADKPLPASTTFTWRVRAFDAAYRYSAWSKEFTFNTGKSATPSTEGAPTVPVLKLPKNKSLVAGYTLVLLDWNDSALPATATAGCLYYEVRVTSPYQNYNASFTTAASEYTIPAENILPADSIFTWQVRSACNDGATTKYSVWSKEFTFRTKLATPTLLSPLDDAVTPLDNIRPTFTWEPVPGAAGYTLQVLKDGKVVVTGAVKAPFYTFTPKKDLFPNAAYTWKVKANGKNPGDYSAPFTFVTGASAPAIPTPTTPKNNALVESAAEQTLIWSLADNATPALSYQVEYATNTAFLESVILPVAEKQLVLPGGTLLPGRTYYWRVRSLSAGNHGAWSKALAIKVKFVAPTLTSPTAGATVGATPTFTWGSANGLWITYTLQIATDAEFKSGLKNFTVKAPVTTFTLPEKSALVPGTYFWRVKINGVYTPITSEAQGFTVAAP